MNHKNNPGTSLHLSINDKLKITASYNEDHVLPEILIISHPRSGTHLLESFLESHPRINGRGEVFLKFEKTGSITQNIFSKTNIGILMYGQMKTFEKLGGILNNHKIIHLIRNPKDVALSILQMEADKAIQGPEYKAHYKRRESIPERGEINAGKKEVFIMEKIIEYRQKKCAEMLRNIEHLEVTYESVAPNNKTIAELDTKLVKRILDYLEIKINDNCLLRTSYVKTGIRRT